MPTEKHTILGGKVHIYRRENSSFWQCSSFLKGKNRRTSTKEEGLAKAKDFAEDWYLELRGKSQRGEIHNEKTFSVRHGWLSHVPDISTPYKNIHDARLLSLT